MKTTNRIRNLCLCGILITSLFGVSLTLSAQTSLRQILENTILDSVAFHAAVAEELDARANNVIAGPLRGPGTPHSGTFTLQGNANTFYPVGFDDDGWWYHEPTILNIGRSNIHANGSNHGSLIATFRYHVTYWGHESHFIDADIRQHRWGSAREFIAGWEDATINNGSIKIVIWLRGGTTYHYYSNYPPNPVLPVFPSGNLTLGSRPFHPQTHVEPYVNSLGPTFSQNVSVRGTLRANEVRVSVGAGADFVFEPDYDLRPLEEVEQFIIENKHLPEIAPARHMIENGIDVSEFQIQLLQKIEELTLYLIEQNKKINELKKEMRVLRDRGEE